MTTFNHEELHVMTCIRCLCGMVPGPEHRAAGAQQRAAWKAAGIRRAGARGLCATCYVFLRKHERLDEYSYTRWGVVTDATPPGAARPCGRCGVLHREPVICADCQLVAEDLHELARWVA